MKQAVGLWIDHRKAVIVMVTERGTTAGLVGQRAPVRVHRFTVLLSFSIASPAVRRMWPTVSWTLPAASST